MIQKMENVDIENTEIDSYLPVIYRKLDWLDKEEVIKRFVAVEFNRFLAYYAEAGDLNISEQEQHRHRHPGEQRDNKDKKGIRYTTLTLQKGKVHGLYPNTLMTLINQLTPGKKVAIGHIDLGKTTARVEVDSHHAKFLSRNLTEALATSVNLRPRGEREQDAPPFKGKFKGRKKKDRY